MSNREFRKGLIQVQRRLQELLVFLGSTYVIKPLPEERNEIVYQAYRQYLFTIIVKVNQAKLILNENKDPRLREVHIRMTKIKHLVNSYLK